MSINPENVGWDGTREGLSRVGDVNIKSRPYDEYNMIILTIEDILQRETIYSDAMNLYLNEIAYISKWSIIAITAGLLFILVLIILLLIRMSIVNPITTLTTKIQNAKKQEDVDSFLIKIQKKAERKQKYISEVLNAEGGRNKLSALEFIN